jgi:hypothetical protein
MRTFYYSEPFDVSISCSFRPLNSSEEKIINGGTNIFRRILFFRTLEL